MVLLLGLPSEVRQAVMAGCLECDLTNAQLAMTVREWDAPIEQYLLQDGACVKIWPLLFDVVGFDYEALQGTRSFAEVKAALKAALYALMFGMSEKGLQYVLMRDLPGGWAETYHAAHRFLQHELARTLLECREHQLAKILYHEGATDCLGNTHALTGTTDAERRASARSILAGLMQAREMQLLGGVIREAIRQQELQRPDFQIIAWQHDGFTVKVRSGKERAIARRLTRLVTEAADELRIPTRLETFRLRR